MSEHGEVPGTVPNEADAIGEKPSIQVKPREKYKDILLGLGISEIVLGSISCILGIVIMVVGAGPFTYIGHGIWGGVFLIASGIFGAVVKKKPSSSVYTANMALSIIAANLMAVVVIMSALDIAVKPSATGVSMEYVLSIIGFVGMIITIVHSAFCCVGVCCIPSRHANVILYIPQLYTKNTHQVIQLPNRQYILVPSTDTAPVGATAAMSSTGIQPKATIA